MAVSSSCSKTRVRRLPEVCACTALHRLCADANCGACLFGFHEGTDQVCVENNCGAHDCALPEVCDDDAILSRCTCGPGLKRAPTGVCVKLDCSDLDCSGAHRRCDETSGAPTCRCETDYRDEAGVCVLASCRAAMAACGDSSRSLSVTNVAPSASAVTLSTTATGAEAARAIDGNSDGAFASGSVAASDLEESPYLEIDLGDVYFVSYVEALGRTDCCGNDLDNLVVLTSLQPMAPSLDTARKSPGVTAFHIESASRDWQTGQKRLAVSVDARVRYVRFVGAPLVGHVDRRIQLAEARVWATCLAEAPLGTCGCAHHFYESNGECLPVTCESLAADCATRPNTAFDLQPVNLAYRAEVRLTSLMNGQNGLPDKATDGNTSGIYSGNESINSVAFSGSEVSPYLEVDLGSLFPIDRVQIWNRTDCCGEGLDDFWLVASRVPLPAELDAALAVSDTLAKRQLLTFGGYPNGAPPLPVVVPIDGFVGRYVRIQLAPVLDATTLRPVQRRLAIAELQVDRTCAGDLQALADYSPFNTCRCADGFVDFGSGVCEAELVTAPLPPP